MNKTKLVTDLRKIVLPIILLATLPALDCIASNDLIIDPKTGYIWKRCVEGMTWSGNDCIGKPRLFTYQEALVYVSKLRKETGQSFRVPTIKELFTLVDYTRTHPAIDPTMFPGTPSEKFMSSTKSVEINNAYWGVFFRNGTVFEYDSQDFDGKPMTFALRLIIDKK